MSNRLYRMCILTVLLIITACSGFPLKQKNYFDKKEKEILERTCKEVGMRFGYNSEIDFNYVFILSEEKQANKNFNKILSDYDDKILYNYYLKIYRLYEMNIYLKDYYKREKIWKNYNIMNIELMPAMDLYFGMLDKYYKSNKSSFYNDLEIQKNDIKIESILYFQDKNNIVGEY